MLIRVRPRGGVKTHVCGDNLPFDQGISSQWSRCIGRTINLYVLFVIRYVEADIWLSCVDLSRIFMYQECLCSYRFPLRIGGRLLGNHIIDHVGS